MAFLDPSMGPPLWHNGPSPGAFYNFPGQGTKSHNSGFALQDYIKRTQTPITTTSSVVAVKFDKGVVVAADTLGSYGSLARFRNCPRISKVNDNILLGCGGDYADFQYLKDIIDQKIIDEKCLGDGLQLKPKSLHCWLTRVLYNKRSKMDPLWSNYVIAGVQDGVPFLGAVDKLGTAYEDSAVATGMGSYLATPLLRTGTESGRPLTQDEALDLVKKAMSVLFYRHARSYPRYQIGVVTEQGVTVGEPIELEQNWQLAHHIQMK